MSLSAKEIEELNKKYLDKASRVAKLYGLEPHEMEHDSTEN